jgi:hypothetical protein
MLSERKMEQDITNFLPKYPDIEELEEVFNPYSDNFYEAIYKKKEFYENKLKAEEPFPSNTGELMKHQKLIARFLSSRTLYDELLIVHAMGTGKSCSAVGAVEQIRSDGINFRGALYLAKGDALVNNFINELIFKCTDGRYIPEDYESLTELEKIHRKKKAIRDYYMTNTFETFAKEISRLNDKEIQRRYNNRVIIIDEVHNLRIQSKKTGLNMYNQFWRFLHTIEDCKIILMSGTPMKDGVDEIASVMNLILPLERQLPTGEEFVEEYFDIENGQYLKVKPSHKQKLKEVFKGRVSYLSNMQSKIQKKFEGSKAGDLKYFDVIQDFMHEHQSKYYDKAYILDRDEREGVYAKSRQASLFVFPDGSYGSAGFNKYVIRESTGKTTVKGKVRNFYRYSLSSALRKEIQADTKEKMLENLHKFSSKYSASIKNILDAYEQGKSVFIYNEYVSGSGLILFGALLELFGFSRASGSEPTGSERPRYALLTNETASTTKIRKLVDRFNKPDNMRGKIISVIIGSRKISEGFSFQNIQVEEIHTPWFNYSETAQAIARGYRLGSHRMLLETGYIPSLTIYQRVSIPAGDLPSIDLEMYMIAEDKDISIKSVERLIKESSWDCGLTYERNYISGYEGQRECDYMECNYVCDGIPPELVESELTKQDLDYSTYQLYYGSENIKKLIEEVKVIFRTVFKMDFYTLLEYLSEYSQFQVITALHKMINENVPIIDKYGYHSYLREEKNLYFLVNSLSVIGNLFSDYYSKTPNIDTQITFTTIVEPLHIETFPSIVDEICKVTTIDQLRVLLNRLSKEIHEFFIESSLLALEKGITTNKVVRDLILEYFKSYYTKIKGTWVCWLLYEDDGIIMCLKDDVWLDCTKEYEEKVKKYKSESQITFEKNPYGFYGQLNKTTGDFCIRDVSKDIPEKKHLRTSGKRCINWKKPEIIPVIIKNLKLPIPKDDVSEPKFRTWIEKIRTSSREKIIKDIKQDKYGKIILDDLYPSNNLETAPLEELKRILFWTKQQIKPLCNYLQNWFDSTGLLVDDPGCGKGTKRKI